MKKSKKLFLVALGMFLSFGKVVNAETTYNVTSTEDYFNKIEEIHNASGEEFTIILDTDIEIASTTTVKNNNTIDNGNTVTIIGNGHTYSITVGDKGRFRVSNGTLNLGKSDGSDTFVVQGAGAGVAAQASLVTVSNGTANMYKGVTLKDNRSGSYGLDGGAVRLGDNGKFNMYGGVMSNNSSETSGAGGGAVTVDATGAVFHMYDGEISDNYAGSWGGAVLLSYYGSVIIEGGTFKNNQGSFGGAIAALDGTVEISNATFDGNESSYGGALLSYNAVGDTNFIISNSTFKNNSASADGGAICAWGTSVTSDNDKIYNNTAKNGGGVKIYTGTADFSTSSVYNNKATTNGNDFSIVAGTEVKISNPTDMTGYAEFGSKKVNLLNWYNDKDGNRYSVDSPTTVITADTVETGGTYELTVSGNEIFVITFDTNGGSEIESQNVELGNKVTEPLDPTKTGFTFGGWYTSTYYDTEFDFNSAISADTAIYAKWNEIVYDFEDDSKNQTINQGNDATFTTTAPQNILSKVYVDDNEIDSSNYSTSVGGTVITLKQAYVDSLSAEAHTLKVEFTDGGVANTTFTIAASTEEQTPTEDETTTETTTNSNNNVTSNPNTGDGIINYIVILVISLFGVFSSQMLLKPSKRN